MRGSADACEGTGFAVLDGGAGAGVEGFVGDAGGTPFDVDGRGLGGVSGGSDVGFWVGVRGVGSDASFVDVDGDGDECGWEILEGVVAAIRFRLSSSLCMLTRYFMALLGRPFSPTSGL